MSEETDEVEERPHPFNYKCFQISIFSACAAPLEKINLAFLNLKFITFKDLQDYAFSIGGQYAKNEIETSSKAWLERWSSEKLIALGPLDFNNPIRHGSYHNILRVLLILFPSDFRQLSLMNFRVYPHNTAFAGESGWSEKPWNEEAMKNPLNFQEKDLPKIESFVRHYFDKPIPKYLSICIDNYAASFYQWKNAVAYLLLCICLESISEGSEQISYRIKRNISIINGEDIKECRRIFGEVGKIYGLRSKIAHGEDFKEELVESYLPYLRSLVSSTIIEVLTHRIEKREKLNEIINELGFGAKTNISSNYDPDLPTYFRKIKPLTETKEQVVQKPSAPKENNEMGKGSVPDGQTDTSEATSKQ
jgi:hypothetical protein